MVHRVSAEESARFRGREELAIGAAALAAGLIILFFIFCLLMHVSPWLAFRLLIQAVH